MPPVDEDILAKFVPGGVPSDGTRDLFLSLLGADEAKKKKPKPSPTPCSLTVPPCPCVSTVVRCTPSTALVSPSPCSPVTTQPR